MGYEPTVFNQLFNFIPRHVFEKSVNARGADRYVKNFKAWHQLLLLLYAQATGKACFRIGSSNLTGLQWPRSTPRRCASSSLRTRRLERSTNFITNNFQLAPTTIAAIYKQRWQIELFFKWIKQNLKIKTFLGTSKNAVMAQVWVAMIYYLLLAYIKFMSKARLSLIP